MIFDGDIHTLNKRQAYTYNYSKQEHIYTVKPE